MPLTVGKAQVMAVLKACREAVAAQYALLARDRFMQTGQRPALAVRYACLSLHDAVGDVFRFCFLIKLLRNVDLGVLDIFSAPVRGVIHVLVGVRVCGLER